MTVSFEPFVKFHRRVPRSIPNRETVNDIDPCVLVTLLRVRPFRSPTTKNEHNTYFEGNMQQNAVYVAEFCPIDAPSQQTVCSGVI